MRALVLALAVLASGSAFAREPKQFVAPREMTAEEIERSKAGKNRIDFYDDALPVEEESFPWRAVVLMGVALAVAAPFGVRTWRNLAKEMENDNAFGSSGASREEDAA